MASLESLGVLDNLELVGATERLTPTRQTQAARVVVALARKFDVDTDSFSLLAAPKPNANSTVPQLLVMYSRKTGMLFNNNGGIHRSSSWDTDVILRDDRLTRNTLKPMNACAYSALVDLAISSSELSVPDVADADKQPKTLIYPSSQYPAQMGRIAYVNSSNEVIFENLGTSTELAYHSEIRFRPSVEIK